VRLYCAPLAATFASALLTLSADSRAGGAKSASADANVPRATGARTDSDAEATPRATAAPAPPEASQVPPGATVIPTLELPAAPRPHAHIQYGVAFTVEGVASAGPICADPNNPCILGSGGGVVVRVGWRPTERLYVGGAYGFSKQDPNKLYRLGILQQARAEVRYYLPTGRSVSPFGLIGGGIAGYGNEWLVDTWGPSATLGAGLELELSGGAVLGFSLAYRPIYLQSFVDSSTLSHAAGLAHFVGVELALEAQDVL